MQTKSVLKNNNVSQKLNTLWKQCLGENSQSLKVDGEAQSKYFFKFLFSQKKFANIFILSPYFEKRCVFKVFDVAEILQFIVTPLYCHKIFEKQ